MKQDDKHISIPIYPIAGISRYAFRGYLYFAVFIIIGMLLYFVYTRQKQFSQDIIVTKTFEEAFNISQKYLQAKVS